MGSAIRRGLRQLRRAPDWRLSTKIMLSFLVLAVGAILFYTQQSQAQNNQVLTRAQSRLLTSLASSVAIQVDSQVLQYRRDAVQVATDPEVVNFMGQDALGRATSGVALLRRLAPALKADPDYQLLLLLDTNGRVVISNEPGQQAQDNGKQEFFARGKVAAAGEPYISDIILAADRRSQIMYTSLPIRDALGTVLGVAAVQIKPDHIAAPLKSRDLANQHSSGLLVSRQGVILANSVNPSLNYKSLGSLDATQTTQIKDQSGLENVSSMGLDDLANQVAGTQTSGFATAKLLSPNETDVIGYAPVSGHGWTVLVAEDQSVFTADVNSLSRNQSINAFVLAMIIAGMVFVVGRLFESTERESLSDPLTGLANRRFLQEILLRELRRAQRSNQPVSLIVADIDHFKGVNDTYGHNVGDEVLEEVAGIMLTGVRATDFVVRYGGEEFVILLPETRLVDAQQVADKLRKTISDTIMESTSRPGLTLKVSLSAGVSSFPVDGGSGEELILKADKALYYAKQHGRNRVVTVTEAEATGAEPPVASIQN